MNLCYIGPESCVEVPDRHPDHKIRIGKKRIHGDNLAQNVLECLAEIACLHGDQIILLQYFPYTWDLIAACKKKMTPNLEGGLLGTEKYSSYLIV